MQVKIYVPQTIDIPSEYLPALAKRAHDNLQDEDTDISATRGHLVRQAVRDGLLREFDNLISDDGSVDLFCDPHQEIPLEIDDRTFSLAELRETLQTQRFPASAKRHDDDLSVGIAPKRKAA